MQDFLKNLSNLLYRQTKSTQGKPSEKKGRKAMDLRMIKIYDCQVALELQLGIFLFCHSIMYSLITINSQVCAYVERIFLDFYLLKRMLSQQSTVQ
ncbi:MAG: hypothetical protein H6Q70_4084 [Firmicutes bacterium]|nr:hypothetical protein [Bacillota bacterium]